jgi:DNA modification methylase
MPANPRTIAPEAMERLKASIQRDPEFMRLRPIVVDPDGIVIGGNQRLRACAELGIDPLPDGWVVRADRLTDDQRRRFILVDNAPDGMSGAWDFERLAVDFADLDLGAIGFSADNMLSMFGDGGTEGLTDPDQVPEPPDTPVTQRGDIWVLGNHRLMCGDSSSPGDLDRLLDGAVIDLLNTDPPYNVKVEPRSATAIAAGTSGAWGRDWQKIAHHQGFDQARGVADPKKALKKMRAKDRPLENDFVKPEAFDEMLLAWFGNASRVLKPGGSFYIWGGYANIGNYPAPLAAAGFYFSQGIVWDKQHPVLTRKDFMGAFEICFYGWKEGAGHKYYGPNNATDLWHVKKVSPQSMIHLTEKPVELAVRAIQYSSLPGQNVLDLFGGSGSTLIGCEQTGRKAFLMELDPPYCDVIVKRWEEFTGRKGERHGRPA